jgi:hypothetical protein
MLNVFSQLTAGTRFNKKKNKDIIELFKGKGIDYNNDDMVEMIMIIMMMVMIIMITFEYDSLIVMMI